MGVADEDIIVRVEYRNVSYSYVIAIFVPFLGLAYRICFCLKAAICNCIFYHITCGDVAPELLSSTFVLVVRVKDQGVIESVLGGIAMRWCSGVPVHCTCTLRGERTCPNCAVAIRRIVLG